MGNSDGLNEWGIRPQKMALESRLQQYVLSHHEKTAFLNPETETAKTSGTLT